MCKKAGIAGFKTNHSLRATAATRLYKEGVDKQLIMERTGHHSIDGVRNYKRTATEQVVEISEILNNTKKMKSSTTSSLAKVSFNNCTNLTVNIN